VPLGYNEPVWPARDVSPEHFSGRTA